MEEVAAGGVVYRKEADQVELLMIKDRFGKWTIPKGRIEPGETLEQTALREIAEETGITGQVIAPLAVVAYAYRDQTRGLVEKKAHYFLVESTGGRLKAQVEEIESAHWLAVSDALAKQAAYGYRNNDSVLQTGVEKIGAEGRK